MDADFARTVAVVRDLALSTALDALGITSCALLLAWDSTFEAATGGELDVGLVSKQASDGCQASVTAAGGGSHAAMEDDAVGMRKLRATIILSRSHFKRDAPRQH